jgi:hypothetical protein
VAVVLVYRLVLVVVSLGTTKASCGPGVCAGQQGGRMTQQQAKDYINANYALIVLHTLYLRWGLPTAMLKSLAPTSALVAPRKEGENK